MRHPFPASARQCCEPKGVVYREIAKAQFPGVVGQNTVDGFKTRSEQVAPRQGMIALPGDADFVGRETERDHVGEPYGVLRNVPEGKVGLATEFEFLILFDG